MAKPGIKLLVLQYLYNRSDIIDQEFQMKISYNRYHRVDEVDLLELIIAKARKDLMEEISRDLTNLLEIHDKR